MAGVIMPSESADASRISEARLAGILNTIAAPLNLRPEAAEGDLAGDYDYWFDGGAFLEHTGSREYTFSDGTTAFVAMPASWLWVKVRFPGGQLVEVVQRRDAGGLVGGETPAAPVARAVAPAGVADEPPQALPEVWHCIYCGGRSQPDHSSCSNCHQVRPIPGESATMVDCKFCGKFSLALAAYCEWCGARINPQ
jgi:hypothetical protein